MKWSYVAALALLSAGCGSDLYAPCSLDERDEQQRQCAQDAPGGGAKICAVENFLACDTNVCARYNSSEAFCTQACGSDADCEGGRCLDFDLFEPGARRYCVQDG